MILRSQSRLRKRILYRIYIRELNKELCTESSIFYTKLQQSMQLLSQPALKTMCLLQNVISQTLKHVRDMFNFNMTSNPHRYLVLFVSKTPSVVWYFIMDLIPPKVRSYFTLFESKSAVIFICIHCLIISFKLRKFTQNLRGVFPSSNLNSYIVFH